MTAGRTPDPETAPPGARAAPVSRRGLLVLGGAAVAVAAAGVGLARLWGAALEYNDLEGLEPFRQLVSDGAVSTGSMAFAGLQREAAEDVAARALEVRAAPCEPLFGDAGADGALPIAYFSDFNCPYCRVLEGVLADVLAADPGLRLVRHELPLLGAASASAARAVLAADLQGGYDVMKTRLLRAGLITDEPYLRAVAGPLGLDADRLIRDMDAPTVTDRLRTSLALGRVFGIVGTPALVIGRTLVVGAVSARTIRAVVRDERAMPEPICGWPA